MDHQWIPRQGGLGGSKDGKDPTTCNFKRNWENPGIQVGQIKLPQSKGIEHFWPGGIGSHVADGRMEVSWMTRMTCLLVQHLAAPWVSQGATWEVASGTSCFVGTEKKEQGFNKKATRNYTSLPPSSLLFYTTWNLERITEKPSPSWARISWAECGFNKKPPQMRKICWILSVVAATSQPWPASRQLADETLNLGVSTRRFKEEATGRIRLRWGLYTYIYNIYSIHIHIQIHIHICTLYRHIYIYMIAIGYCSYSRSSSRFSIHKLQFFLNINSTLLNLDPGAQGILLGLLQLQQPRFITCESSNLQKKIIPNKDPQKLRKNHRLIPTFFGGHYQAF